MHELEQGSGRAWWATGEGASMPAQMRSYGVAIRREGGDHHVTVRDLPEVVTAGDTHAEALELAKDAIAVAVAGRLADGMALPEPSPLVAGEIAVELPA